MTVTTHTKTRTAPPLSGVKVIELGSLIAGPFATRILADFGADVIKIENPAIPDPMRNWGKANVNGHTLWWSVQARNKQLLELDIKTDAGVAALRRLLSDADVLVENMRPGTLERLGLAPARLHEINPGLIIARVSGYGQDGPRAHLPGYASVAEAASGLRHLNGYPDQPPPRAGISLGDSLGSLYAVQGILMALYWRDTRGGSGQVVDVSLVESCFSLLESAVPDYAATGYIPGPSGSKLDGIAPSNIYRSSDLQWVVIAANQDTVFRRLCAVMNAGHLTEDSRFTDHQSRGRNQEALDDIIAAWAAEHTADELDDLLNLGGVPTSRVNDIATIFADPMFTERGMLIDVADEQFGTVTHPGIVPKLSRTPGTIRWGGMRTGPSGATLPATASTRRSDGTQA